MSTVLKVGSDVFEQSLALNKVPDVSSENLYLHLRSSKGFPIYNSYYKDLQEHILGRVKSFNNRLREHYVLNHSKSGAILNAEDPSMRHYLERFPEKQFKISPGDLFLKPACCASAFKIWGSKGVHLKKKQVMHEVSDCYRLEYEGTVRTFRRNCVFTMPDYHMITVEPEMLKDFSRVRELIFLFYEDLLGPDWAIYFEEIVRVSSENYQKYREFIDGMTPPRDNQLVVHLNDYKESPPYFELKYELAYRGGPRLITLGTIQIDYLYPKMFELDQSKYGPRPALHFTQGSVPRIVELMVNQGKTPCKGVKLFTFKGVDRDLVIEALNLKCAILLDNTSVNLNQALKSSPLEALFFPTLIVVGEQELRRREVATLDRNSKINRNYTYEELSDLINRDRFFMESKQIHYSSTFCRD